MWSLQRARICFQVLSSLNLEAGESLLKDHPIRSSQHLHFHIHQVPPADLLCAGHCADWCGGHRGHQSRPTPAHAPAFRPQRIEATGDDSVGKRKPTVGEVLSGTKTWAAREALQGRNTPTTSEAGENGVLSYSPLPWVSKYH